MALYTLVFDFSTLDWYDAPQIKWLFKYSIHDTYNIMEKNSRIVKYFLTEDAYIIYTLKFSDVIPNGT